LSREFRFNTKTKKWPALFVINRAHSILLVECV